MKTIFVAQLPEVFGYGLMVADTDKDKALKALEEEYRGWVIQRGQDPDDASDYDEQETHEDGTPYTRFEMAMEYYGGGVQEVELGKIYYDNFQE